MTMPRYSQVSLSDTPWYHVVCRCVRRAFLCGQDNLTGQNYAHRRGWIEQRIGQLASIFAIDVAAYAVMSNHYHLVVRIDAPRAENWSDEQVLQRWTQIFTGPLLVRRFLDDEEREKLSDSELDRVYAFAQSYRERLCDLSWFMRVLNETIARKANAEDNCTGRFWEGRFKCQALLDEQALLSAMAYVDLNPVRAGMTQCPEQGDHTSIHKRVKSIRSETETGTQNMPSSDPSAASRLTEQASSPHQLRCERTLNRLATAPLMPFEPTETLAASIPFSFDDYLDLVDTVGRVVHPEKRGSIPEHTPVILERLGMDAEMFIAHADQLLKSFAFAIGAPQRLVELAASKNCSYLRGIARARQLYSHQSAA
jgi:REP element-mobilizing transposase RayT